MARSLMEATVRVLLFFVVVPLTVALEFADAGRGFGSEMVTFVGLFDMREATAAERAR